MAKKIHWLAALVLGIFMVMGLFSNWLNNLNSGVIEPWGDGFKAYHAIIYHARYDSTYSWYQGMNYPYGEHVVPGASQPLLSNGMKVLQSIGIPASDYGWGIIHGSILLGIVLAVLFTYLLLRRLGVGFLLSLIGSGFLTLMAPQVFRIGAHYGLAHLEVLPIALYFLHRWHTKPGWQRCLPLAGVVTIFSLIHFYYFAILAFTLGGFLGAHWLLSRQWKRWWFYGVQLFLMFGLAAIAFFSWFELTDPTVGRNDAPYGYEVYQAHPTSVFTSHFQPHWRGIMSYKATPSFEGWAYIGLPAIGLLGLLAVLWLARRFRQPFLPATTDQRLYLNALLLAGAGLLLFSFGFPMDELGGAKLMEKLGPLKQFRSLGRFAWLFYYAIGIGLWYSLHLLLKHPNHFFSSGNKRKKWIAYTLIGLTIAVSSLEVVNRWKQLDFRQLRPIADLFEEPLLSDQIDIDYDRYQAIVPLPYYNIGSGNFWLDQSGWVAHKMQVINWQTGLPSTAAMLTRTALWQTLKQLQFMSEPYRTATLLADLPNQKPFLLIVDTKYRDHLGLKQDHLSNVATFLAEKDNLLFYELPLDAYQQQLNNYQALAFEKYQQDSSLVVLNEFSISDSLPFYYQNFDGIQHNGFGILTNEVAKPITKSTPSKGYRQQGLSGDLGNGEDVFDIKANIDSGHYVLSFWIDLKPQRHARSVARLHLSQKNDWHKDFPLNEHLRLLDNNGWALIEIPLSLGHHLHRLRLNLQMPLLEGQQFRVDDVLLRPADLDVFQQFGDELFYNNRYYPLQEPIQ